MALLRFTNPTDIPAYGDWDFVVLGAEFALRAEDMRDVYAAYLEDHRRYFSNLPKDSGRHAAAQEIAELHAMLVDACQVARDLTLDGHDVWWCSDSLMFEKRFVSVRCPECRQEFGPEACRVLKWSFARGELAGSGGRRVVCPANHTLYSRGEWTA